MPSSIEHCEICAFEEIVPATDNDIAVLEDIITKTYLHNLQNETRNVGISPDARYQGISATREFAAKSCAACIFANGCPEREFVFNTNNGMYWLQERKKPS